MTVRLHRLPALLAGALVAVVLASACSTVGTGVRFADEAAGDAPAGEAPIEDMRPPQEETDWSPLGEPGVGGRITGLAIDPFDPDRILVGGDLLGAGVSVDAGATWQPTFGLTNGELSRFTFHPSVPGEVWVGTMGGPFVSFDGGRTWQGRRNGMPAPLRIGYSAPIDEILVDPAAPDRLLAFGGSHREWDAPGTVGRGVVWESRDHGTTWAALATVGDGANLVDATWLADGTLLVAALGKGVFRSADGGRTWSATSTGLPHNGVRALAAHPTDRSAAWVALGAGPGSPPAAGGVWRSADGGRTWSPSGTGLDLVAPTRPQAEFAPRYHVLAVAPSDPDVLLTANLAYGAEAVYRSTDGGRSWLQVIGSRTIGRPPTAYSTPITADAVAIDPVDADRALVGNAEFVLGTTDGGRRWSDLTSDVLPDGSATGRGYSGLVATRIVYSPDGSELLLCGMDGANPLVRTTRRTGWTRPLAASDPWGGCADAAFSRSVPGRRFVLLGQAGIFGGVAVLEADDTFRLRTGPAAGLPERGARAGELGAVEVVTSGGRELVFVAVGGLLYRSVDGASTFEVVDRSLGATELAADPVTPGRLYVAGARGVAISDDGGASLRRIPASPAEAVRLAVDASTGHLYAAVWRTVDAGLWRFDGSTFALLLDEDTTFDVAIDPADPRHLLVATNDHPYHDVIRSVGMLESVDGGLSWEPRNDGLPMLRVSAVAFDPARSGQVVIGTFGRGFFSAGTPGRPAG
jgi:photosystem II stability/assembly factor-like uncharacterized protein